VRLLSAAPHTAPANSMASSPTPAALSEWNLEIRPGPLKLFGAGEGKLRARANVEMIGFFDRQILPLVAPLCSARQPFAGSTQLPKGSALIDAIARYERGEIKMSAGGYTDLSVRQMRSHSGT
jgi:hypothetical protein